MEGLCHSCAKNEDDTGVFIQGAETHTGRNTSGETQAFTLEKRKKIVCKYEQMDSYVMMRGLMRISLIHYD